MIYCFEMIIMTNVHTLKIKYIGCEDKIWRETQISSNAHLCDLGYMILATFDTMAYHLFNISYKGVTYELPSYEEEISEDKCVLFVKLSELNLKIGDKLTMIYDFGCDQEFEIEVTDIQPMGKGQGRAYPKIIAGEGRGIIDDMSADDLAELIQQIDKTGSSGIQYAGDGIIFDNMPNWDYRNYSLEYDNCLLKGIIARIAEGYEELMR